MKISKKDILILVIPIGIIILAFPILPDKIPMQFALDGSVNWSLDKHYSFLLGVFPFILYKLMKIKYGR